MASPPLSLKRQFLFAVTTAAAILWALNSAIEFLEDRGKLDTDAEGVVPRSAEEPLWAPSGDGWIRPTAYARKTLVSSPFLAEKGGRRRIFVLGESWAMGSPYVHQGQPQEGAGGVPFWLREAFDRAGFADAVEVVNAAAGGQDSGRVADIADQALDQRPDLLVVATCNNEAAPPPGEVRKTLRQLGGYRLLDRLLAPPPAPGGRAWFTLPDPDTAAIRRGFEQNVRRILDHARAVGVRVALATLPVNLMYDGLERELVMSAEEERLRPCLEAGVTPFDAGDFQDSILALRQCLGLPEARRWIAMAELRTTGRSRLTADLESVWGPCVQGGVEELYGGSAEVAVDLLRRCDELDESLRWLGLALARSGRMDEAALALEQSTELLPRNRCRPSFNALLRRLAGEDPNVILVDLDATARAASAPLLPGRDLFVDSCHMNWRGYGLMAAQVLRKVGEAGAGILPLVPVPTEAEILVWGEGRGLPAPEVGP